MMCAQPNPNPATDQLKPRCACPEASPYACWGRRYGLARPWGRSSIQDDGGPCECTCHDRFACDDEGER